MYILYIYHLDSIFFLYVDHGRPHTKRDNAKESYNEE